MDSLPKKKKRPSCPHCRRQMPNKMPGFHPRPPESSGAPEVDVAKVRKAFERSGMSKCELARLMDWMREVPNIDRVNVTLGYRTQAANGKFKLRLTYGVAVRLAKAMNADYYEVGV